MVKRKKSEELCDTCSAPLRDEDVIKHSGNKFCPKCMAEHIRDDHYTSEIGSVWTYRRAQ